jgi:hypothetical protein
MLSVEQGGKLNISLPLQQKTVLLGQQKDALRGDNLAPKMMFEPQTLEHRNDVLFVAFRSCIRAASWSILFAGRFLAASWRSLSAAAPGSGLLATPSGRFLAATWRRGFSAAAPGGRLFLATAPDKTAPAWGGLFAKKAATINDAAAEVNGIITTPDLINMFVAEVGRSGGNFKNVLELEIKSLSDCSPGVFFKGFPEFVVEPSFGNNLGPLMLGNVFAIVCHDDTISPLKVLA